MSNVKILNDPRNLTTYKTQSTIDRDIIEKSNIKNNYEFRQFLTKNGSSIVDTNNIIACNNVSNCNNATVNKTGSPYIFKSLGSNIVPNLEKTSDLKQEYLSRESLNRELYNKSIY